MVEHCEGQKITGKNLDKKDAQQMLDMLVEQAKYKGANGILSVRINKQDITWYTQGVAVRFEKAPSLQKQSYIISHNNKENNTHALSVAESDKIASETANYLWEHKMRFLKSDGIYGDRYFDIENNEYITDKAYIKKYGEPVISKITNMLKEKKLNEKTYKKEIKKRAK